MAAGVGAILVLLVALALQLLPGPSLHGLITSGHRGDIADWASHQPNAAINAAVASLDDADRGRLVSLLLDSPTVGAQRLELLATMESVLGSEHLGFLIGTWATTPIVLSDRGTGTCDEIDTSTSAYSPTNTVADARIDLLFGSFMSFACREGAGSGMVVAGAANWIGTAAFGPQTSHEFRSLRDSTFNQVLIARNENHSPVILVAPDLSESARFVAVMDWLASVDPSHLDWRSTDKLDRCFQAHYASFNAVTGTDAQWQTAELAADADPTCRT